MKERGQSKDSDHGGAAVGHGGSGSGRTLVGAGIDGRTIRDSMEYYRMWIFSSNAVLGLTSAIFIVFGAFVMADSRLSLLREVELYHPTFLYAYVALLLQCGLLQVVGCLGAKNLSEKLLSLYWASLLLLTVGDIVVGVFWVFKLDSIKTNLIGGKLGEDFQNKYSIDPHFTAVWNRVQTEEHCCGVNGPQDFHRFLTSVHQKPNSWENDSGGFGTSLPESCCTVRVQHISGSQSRRKRNPKSETSNQRRKRPRETPSGDNHQHQRHSAHHLNQKFPPNLTFSSDTSTEKPSSSEDIPELSEVAIPSFLCGNLHKQTQLSEVLGMTSPPESIRSLPLTMVQSPEDGGDSEERRHRVRHVDGIKPVPSHQPAQIVFRARNKVRVYRNGCADKLVKWVEWVSGVLFILGFCILGFSKFCFLVILRREIREMIEKIQILKKEGKAAALGIPGPPSYNSRPRNSIHKQYSTQSGAMSTVSGVSVAGITIKSPPGESHSHAHYFSTLTHPTNHAPRMSIHYDHYAHHMHHDLYHLDHLSARRHSARSLGADSTFLAHRKSQSQSQETVHMNLLISNHKLAESASQTNRNDSGGESISFKVPTPEERVGKRANWAQGSPWELNVSGDSSVSGGPGGYDPSSPPGTTYSMSSNSPAPMGRQELVEVSLEKGPLSTGSSLEEPTTTTPGLSPVRNRNSAVPEPVTKQEIGPDLEIVPDETVPLLERTTPQPLSGAFLNSNGNNNLDKIDFDLDSDFVMALIGTPV